MITEAAWAWKRYAVLGLARSGGATVDALLASRAEVVGWDSSDEVRATFNPSPRRGDGGARALAWEGEGAPDDIAPRSGHPHPTLSLEGEGLRGRFSLADPLTLDLATFDAIVVSPGVPLNRHPIAAAARAADVPVIGDIELFAQARASLPPHKVVGITGTNGKSTTTALIHHILRTAGISTTMGGNIGLPILAQEPLAPNANGVGVYVLELSSYQLDLTQTLDCEIAVLLNITPDHLDRYDGFEAYAASKLRLFAMQSADHMAVTESLLPELGGSQAAWPALQGPHNAQNAAAAIIVARVLGVEAEVIDRALCSFPGLPHRMERVGLRDDDVLFVNDSKATNPASAAPALAAFEAVHWIVGGRAKSDELDACAPYFGHVRAAYAIGEAGPVFASILRPHMPVHDCGNLVVAVREAAAAARPGEVVLLSPAAASFDQFTDYEARGDAFRAAVEALG